MTASEFVTKVEFEDGTTVTLGGGDEFYVEQSEEGRESCMLNSERLNLIDLLQKAEKEAVG